MQLEHIKYIFEIAKCQSINTAADNLYMLPSTLSNCLKVCEKHLGFKLFYRTPKGVIPTPQGQEFLNDFADTLPLLNKYFFKDDPNDKAKTQDSITFYISSSFINYCTKNIIVEFSKLYPYIDIVASDLAYHINNRDIFSLNPTNADLIMFLSPEFINIDEYVNNQNLKSTLLMTFNSAFYISKNNPLAQKDHLTLDDFQQSNLALFSSTTSNIVPSCKKYFHKIFKVPSVNEIFHLVLTDNAITFAVNIPQLFDLTEAEYSTINTIASYDAVPLPKTFNLYLFYHPGYSKEVKLLIDFIKTKVANDPLFNANS